MQSTKILFSSSVFHRLCVSMSLSLQEASISIWLQFSDDTASLLSSFSDLPFFLHLSSLAETVVGVTPGPSQSVFAQGDGGGPLLRAELLVSSCVDQSITSNSITEGQMDMTDTRGGRGTKKLARGSGWIRVNLDLGSLQPLGNKYKEEEEFDFDISDMLVESDSDVYSNFDEGGENGESENLSSSEYYNKVSGSITNRNWKKVGNGGMVSRNNLERAVLMPSQEEGTVYFSPSQEKAGEREEEDEQGARELEVGVGTILSLLCLSAALFLANCLPCALCEKRRKIVEEEREQQLEAGTKEEEEDEEEQKKKEVDRKLEDRKETEGEDKPKQEQVEDNKEDVKEVEIIC